MYLFFKQNIQGRYYTDLIDHCYQRCDAFLLVYINYDHDPQYCKVTRWWQQELLCDLILERHNPIWPSIELIDYRGEVTICIYRFSPHAFELIRSSKDLFSWNYPDKPEDISFLKAGKCYLGISAHEEYAFIDNNYESRGFLLERGISFRKVPESPYFEHYKI